jgi:hypothetical protein
MIMKRYILQPFVTVLLLILISSISLRGQDLSFTINLDKATYHKGDTVKCIMTLTNNSNKNLVINNRFLVNRPLSPHEISFEFIGPDMKPVTFISKINASSQSKKYIVLKPGNSQTKTYQLTEDFELTGTGNYSVTAYYNNRFDAPASLKMSSAWKGNLISNKVSFTIN